MALLPHTSHVSARPSKLDPAWVLARAHANRAASAKAVRVAALTMLHSWDDCRAWALAQDDFATVASCEDAIIEHELFLASLDRGAAA